MKIIFLITLILAALICIESYVGAQHMMNYVPVNPDHCHGPNNQDCLGAVPLEYEYYTPENSVERVYSYEANFWSISRSAQHMMHYVPVNADHCHGLNNQDCLAAVPLEYEYYTPENSVERVYSYEANFWSISRSAQRMMYYEPENPDLCRGPNNQDCLAAVPLEYENYTPENSVERVYSYDLNFWSNSRSFCPKRYSWHCRHKIHECCSDNDCHPLQFCCYENCGNTCQFPIAYPADGVRVAHHDPHCYVDERFVRVQYAPLLNLNG